VLFAVHSNPLLARRFGLRGLEEGGGREVVEFLRAFSDQGGGGALPGHAFGKLLGSVGRRRAGLAGRDRDHARGEVRPGSRGLGARGGPLITEQAADAHAELGSRAHDTIGEITALRGNGPGVGGVEDLVRGHCGHEGKAAGERPHDKTATTGGVVVFHWGGWGVMSSGGERRHHKIANPCR
jgi:hypothetical protein